ncbi:MAG: DNA mismatch repair protein MutS, partial [Anaerolineae bacterium]
MTTPMRRQYLDLKRQYKDTILFFRLGDFYETFDDDAKIVASVCDVVLTSRPVGADMRVPLAGVPWHSVDGYVARLIQAGYKVAIAEQQGEAPVDGLVPRLVNRIVSAGTVVEPGLLPEKRNNYLVAGVRQDDRVGVAYADITTGEFATTEFSGADAALRLREELARLQPAELLTVEDGFAPSAELGLAPGASTRLPPWRFELETARRALLDHFHVQTLAGFGCDSKPLAISAAGALLQYLREMQPSALAQLTSLYTYSLTEFMVLDEATRRNLELTESIRGSDNRHTLLAVLDDTRTPMGARLLRRRLGQPLLDLTQLDARLGAVAALQQQGLARAELLA